MLRKRRAAGAAAPLLATPERGLFVLPMVRKIRFKSRSQTTFKGFPCWLQAEKGAAGVGVAAPMHGLQQAALGRGHAVSTLGQEG